MVNLKSSWFFSTFAINSDDFLGIIISYVFLSLLLCPLYIIYDILKYLLLHA